MTIETRDFGSIEIAGDDIIRFVQPILGFEEQSRYVLISDPSIGDQFYWLQSADERDICFIVANAAEVSPGYRPKLQKQVREQLDLSEKDSPLVLTIAVITDDFTRSTHNMKSPVIVNKTSKLASQVVLEEDFPVRASLFEQERGA